MNTSEKIEKITNSMASFLKEKNRRYGDSALSPLSIFTNHVSEKNDSATNNFYTRIDDKLSRIKNGEEVRENDIVDLIGYLVLYCAHKGWDDFSHLLD